MVHASQGCAFPRPIRAAGCLLLGLLLGVPTPAAGENTPKVPGAAGGRWNTTRSRSAQAQATQPPSPSDACAALLWSHACAFTGELAEWYDVGFLRAPGVYRAGLDAIERRVPSTPEGRLLEARLRIGLAEALLDPADSSRNEQADEQLRRALKLLSSASGHRSRDASLLAARAHLALAQLADSAEAQIGLLRQALADLADADSNHPQVLWLTGQCHLALADAFAGKRGAEDEARDHYRRALPVLYRLRHAGVRGAEALACWHVGVARLAWREGNPQKAEEHASTARELFRQAGGCTRRGLLGVAQAEHLLGRIALEGRGSPEDAARHLQAAWHAYEQYSDGWHALTGRDRGQQSSFTPFAALRASHPATPDGLNRVACGLQLADLLIARGDVEGGLSVLEQAVAGGDPAVAVPDRVLAHLARSTVIEEHLRDYAGARAEVRKASELAALAPNPAERRLTALWAMTRQAELSSREESPQSVAADLRRGLQASRPTGPLSAEEALAEARALHLLADLEAAMPEDVSPVEEHYRDALAAYRQALRQGVGAEGELGMCYLDLAILLRTGGDRPAEVTTTVHEAIRLLADAAPEEPENYSALCEAHLAAAVADDVRGGSPAVCLGHWDSAVVAARAAVEYELPGAHLQLARLLDQRGHWELEQLDAGSTAREAAKARAKAIAWFQEACATYRLGRELNPEAVSPRDEVPCRATLAGLLWEENATQDQAAEQLAIARELLDEAPQQGSECWVERARLNQFDADLLVGDPRTVRQAAIRLESAVQDYEKALSLADAEHAPDQVRDVYLAELEVAIFNLADCYATYLGDAVGAAEWFRKDLSLQKQMALDPAERQANESLVLMRLGLVESQLRGDPDRAAGYYESARDRLNLAREGGVADAELVVRVLVGLGMLGGQLPPYEGEAEKHFTDAAELARCHEQAVPRLAGFEYSARHGLAMHYERTGRYNAAAGQMRRCVQLGQELDLESLAEDRAYLATLSRLAQAQSGPGDETRMK